MQCSKKMKGQGRKRGRGASDWRGRGAREHVGSRGPQRGVGCFYNFFQYCGSHLRALGGNDVVGFLWPFSGQRKGTTGLRAPWGGEGPRCGMLSLKRMAEGHGLRSCKAEGVGR